MDSGLFLSIFSSWEMIGACLFVMLVLPLVFFVASTRSRRRPARRVPASHKSRTARKPAAAAPQPPVVEPTEEDR
jgi:hypothetical protein